MKTTLPIERSMGSGAPMIGETNATVCSAAPRVSIVVPCYNEEAVLPEAARRLTALLAELRSEGLVDHESLVLFVDDGSKDKTWQIIDQLSREKPECAGLKLARNVGHQNALVAGLFNAPGDVIASIDADLQDDPAALRQMLIAHRYGADIVNGVRANRESDTFFKRFTAESYYRLLNAMGVRVLFNHADYRLMSRRAVEALREFGEVNLFLRGVVPMLGFSVSTVAYARTARFAGESKYPLRKMLALAWEGITSFTVLPLRWITVIGFLLSLSSFAVALWAIFIRAFTTRYLPGWTSTVVPLSIFSGIQLFSLGIIGEYLGKVYMEAKRRPRFIVEQARFPASASQVRAEVQSGAGGRR
jgi:glycosyltransferase involved in cell wall biosynthesis